MLRKITKVLYSAFISIILISFFLTGWTSFIFFSQSSKSVEIIKVLNDIYLSQKSVIVNIVNLSKILAKEEIVSRSIEEDNLFIETELKTDVEESSQVDLSKINEEIVDNSLEIVSPTSLTEYGENALPEINENPLVAEGNEFSPLEEEDELEMDISS